MKRSLALILSLFLILSLAACGGGGQAKGSDPPANTSDPGQTPVLSTATAEPTSKTTEPAKTDGGSAPDTSSDVVGHYTGIGYEYSGVKMEPTGEWLKLEANNRGILTIINKEYPLAWKLEGEKLTLNQDVGVSYTGILKNGDLTLDAGAMKYYFTKGEAGDNKSAPGSSKPAATPTTVAAGASGKLTAEMVAFWSRDWYGWWDAKEAAGDLAKEYELWWDMCLRINVDESGNGTMVVWDEYATLDKPWGQVKVTIDPTKGNPKYGVLTVAPESELNFGDGALNAAGWVLDPNEWKYENTIGFDGMYLGAKVQFKYAALLRPWGQRWEDIKANDPELLPYAYADWYLPLIEANKPIPNKIG